MGNAVVSGYRTKERIEYRPKDDESIRHKIEDNMVSMRKQKEQGLEEQAAELLLRSTSRKRLQEMTEEKRKQSMAAGHSSVKGGDGEWMYNLNSLAKQYDKSGRKD